MAPNVGLIFRQAGRLISDNSPAILTATAVAGVLSTAVLATKATINVTRRLDNEHAGEVHLLPLKTVVEEVWKDYIPAAAVGAATIACIIGANTISTRRNAALISVYSITESAFKDYQEKVRSQIGERQEQKVRDTIAQDRVANDPDSKEVVIFGTGEVLCYDLYTGRYFTSTMETLRKAQNDLNAKIISDMYASQNDFYTFANLPRVTYGDEVGWNIDHLLELDFSSVLSTDGKPCLAIGFRELPTAGYHKFG